MIPFDPEKPSVTSGLRVGTPAGTTRGFGIHEFEDIGEMIGDIIDGLRLNPEDNSVMEKIVKEKTLELCRAFPIYPNK